ncbi:MAG: hypothetical protein WC071_08045, partial [Victivallaceae bacterium]
HYRDKGDMSTYGMKSYTLVFNAWPKHLRGAEKKKAHETPPSDEHIASLVKNITVAKSPVIYDIEHWPLDIRKSVKTVADDDISTASNKAVDASMDKMIHIISESKKVNPNVKYGYYACVPLREYWTPVKNNPEKMKQWHEANDYLKPLADSVDVICPSLYAFYADHDGWVKYAKANIAEAKRLANGKPVYAYLWPKYHNSNKESGKKFIDGNFWKLQLETVYNSGIDGVIIWDSPLVVNNPADKVWNPNREWWKETVSFLKRINKQP